MPAVYLSLGSNLGDRRSNIREALDRLAECPGIRVEQVSSMYETAPIGVENQPDFVNAVALLDTVLDPMDLFDAARQVESDMGRERTARWGPRVIDIDILLYENLVMSAPELTIPHPQMTERAFVMVPLAEIAPDLTLPGGRKPCEVLDKLPDQGVCRLSEV